MKRLLFGAVALLLVSSPAYSLEGRSAMVKLGVLTGEIDTDSAVGDEDLDTNLTVGLEYFFRFESGLDLGIGGAFERHELKSADFKFGFNEIESYPVYGLIRYRIKNDSNWTPYVYSNLGYAFADESKAGLSVDGGMYYGAGVGVEYRDDFGLEAGWARTEFDADYEDQTFDPESDVFKLSITMRLDH